jgi:hypothetical protein
MTTDRSRLTAVKDQRSKTKDQKNAWLHGCMKKSQITNNKFQTINKKQISNSKQKLFLFCGFGHWLL